MSRLQASKAKTNEVPVLKMKISELESQVADYKRRIEELRKAKNTTILKREREVLDVRAPDLGQRRSSENNAKVTELEKRLQETEERHRKEKEELSKRHKEDLEKLRNNKASSCNHEPEIERLKKRVTEVEADNAALVAENQDLKERVDSLLTELSVKEAKWCETEEQLNLKLKQQWGEKYREWMEETEKKLEELQHANALLRGYLKKSRPDGSDPTGQD